MKSIKPIHTIAYPFYFITFFLLVVAINPFSQPDTFDPYWLSVKFILPKFQLVLIISLFSFLLLLVSDYLFNPNCFKFDLGLIPVFAPFFVSLHFTLLNTNALVYSVFGHPEMGDGYLYWVSVLLFAALNYRVISAFPGLFHAQLHGFLFGLIPLGLTSLFSYEVFYTHRAHVSFVFLIAAALLKGYRPLFASPVLLSNTVTSIAVYLSLILSRFLKYKISYYFLVCLALLVFIALDSYGFAHATLFERFKYWSYAIHTMDAQHLIFGYGFNGFDIALKYHPAKAHNLLIDNFISWGLSGLVFYSLIMLYFLKEFIKNKNSSGLTLLAVYFIYTFFWYDSAQYTHFVYWGLSSCLALANTSVKTSAYK